MFKIVNGVQVPLNEEELAERELERQKHLDKINSLEYRVDQVRHTRENLYPKLGDQFDAIIKQFIKMQRNGFEIEPSMGALIETVKSIKAAHPKPTE